MSNKGKPGGNHELRLSFKRSGVGHVKHLDPSKFCPPDHRGPCSCKKAKRDAIACGLSATGTCRIQ